MLFNTSDIREKDVINICTGKRIGYICDFVIDASCGKITSVIVSCSYFSLVGNKNSVCIPWDKVSCIGDDAVLVCADGECICDSVDDAEQCRRADKRRRGWFF